MSNQEQHGRSKTRCHMCDRLIKDEAKAVWLEFSDTDGELYEPDKFPDGHRSLGCFPVGADCAKKVINKHQ
jgi:hypothetical protein